MQAMTAAAVLPHATHQWSRAAGSFIAMIFTPFLIARCKETTT